MRSSLIKRLGGFGITLAGLCLSHSQVPANYLLKMKPAEIRFERDFSFILSMPLPALITGYEVESEKDGEQKEKGDESLSEGDSTVTHYSDEFSVSSSPGAADESDPKGAGPENQEGDVESLEISSEGRAPTGFDFVPPDGFSLDTGFRSAAFLDLSSFLQHFDSGAAPPNTPTPPVGNQNRSAVPSPNRRVIDP